MPQPMGESCRVPCVAARLKRAAHRTKTASVQEKDQDSVLPEDDNREEGLEWDGASRLKNDPRSRKVNTKGLTWRTKVRIGNLFQVFSVRALFGQGHSLETQGCVRSFFAGVPWAYGLTCCPKKELQSTEPGALPPCLASSPLQPQIFGVRGSDR